MSGVALIVRIGNNLTDIQDDSLEFRAETFDEAVGFVRMALANGYEALVYEAPAGKE